VLRNDYPLLFSHKPELSIFREDVGLYDHSGKRIAGSIKQYERIFDALRFLRRTTMQDAQVTYRLIVDDDKIRIRWSAKLWMRDPALGLIKLANGEPALIHIDGISIYQLDSNGKISSHWLENIIMRGKEEAQLAFAWSMPQFSTPELAIPFFSPLEAALPGGLAILPLPNMGSRYGEVKPPSDGKPLSTLARRSREPMASAASDSSDPKAPETPMQRAAREREEDMAKAQRLRELRTPKQKQHDLFGIGRRMPQPCDTSYDCERPKVCCDLLVASVCCDGGMMIPTTDRGVALQRQAIPISVDERDGPFPPQNPPPRTGR